MSEDLGQKENVTPLHDNESMLLPKKEYGDYGEYEIEVYRGEIDSSVDLIAENPEDLNKLYELLVNYPEEETLSRDLLIQTNIALGSVGKIYEPINVTNEDGVELFHLKIRSNYTPTGDFVRLVVSPLVELGVLDEKVEELLD